MEQGMIEMLQLIVTKVDSLGNEIKGVKENQQKLGNEIAGVKENQQKLGNEIAGVKENQQKLGNEIADVKENQQKLGNEIAGVKENQQKLGNEIAGVKENQQKLDEELHSIKLTLENETNRKINLMYESHQSIIKKQEKLAEVDGLKERVSNLEHAVMVHTSQIAELKQA